MIIEEEIEEGIEVEIEEGIEEEIEEVEKYMNKSTSKEDKATHRNKKHRTKINRRNVKKEKLLIKAKIEIPSKTIIEVEIIMREKENLPITIKASLINLIKSTTLSRMMAEPNSTNKKIKITKKAMNKMNKRLIIPKLKTFKKMSKKKFHIHNNNF